MSNLCILKGISYKKRHPAIIFDLKSSSN